MPAQPTNVTRLEIVLLLGRLVLGFVVLAVVVSFVSSHYRVPLMAMGHHVVEHFGLGGMAMGTLIAEAFQFPVPPQFYMLVSIAAGAPPGPVLFAITCGSLAGGHLGMLLARRAAAWKLVKRVTERGMLPRLFRRHQWVALSLGSVLPFPFSILCYTCGVLRTPYRAFLLVCALRIPKLVVYYAVIRAGWVG